MKKIIDKIKKTDKSIFFFAGLAILILWQMLLPGYVLTLDMIFADKIKLYYSGGDFLNSLPLWLVLKLINIFLPGWVIQKIILFDLFFLIGYLAYKFLPVPKNWYARYGAAVFYVINPFVYERFLAGHWMHLFAYAFFPPVAHYLIIFFKSPRIKPAFLAFSWLLGLAVFSLHYLTIALILIIFSILSCLVYYFFYNKNKMFVLAKYFFANLLGFIFANLYWLLPYLISVHNSPLNIFQANNWEVFKTASDARLGTAANVLALYGFWAESHPWTSYFLSAKDNLIIWIPAFVILIIIAVCGAAKLYKRKKKLAFFYFLFFLLAFIFSCGNGDTIFAGLNHFLFKHIFFWPGFRDSQKWSGILALMYAIFFGWGAVRINSLAKRYASQKLAEKISIILMLIPIIYAYPMVGGFARQVRPVWYPKSWQEANRILNKDKSEFNVLFLPWHGYLSLDFNNKLVSANPAKLFFDKNIIQGENMEIGNIFSQGNSREYNDIENAVTIEKNKNQTIETFRRYHIKYIIFSDDLAGVDQFHYEFVKSRNIKPIFEKSGLTIYQVMLN